MLHDINDYMARLVCVGFASLLLPLAASAQAKPE